MKTEVFIEINIDFRQNKSISILTNTSWYKTIKWLLNETAEGLLRFQRMMKIPNAILYYIGKQRGPLKSDKIYP